MLSPQLDEVDHKALVKHILCNLLPVGSKLIPVANLLSWQVLDAKNQLCLIYFFGACKNVVSHNRLENLLLSFDYIIDGLSTFFQLIRGQLFVVVDDMDEGLQLPNSRVKLMHFASFCQRESKSISKSFF